MQTEKTFLTVSCERDVIDRLDEVAWHERFTRSCLARRLLDQGLAALQQPHPPTFTKERSNCG